MNLLGRRDFLAAMGLGPGAYLLGSIFRSNLLPEAMGATARRKQFILVTSGQGFLEEKYTCNARSETDFDLASAYDPVAAYKNDLVIVSKLYNPVDRMQHGNSYAFLSVTPAAIPPTDGFEIAGGITIDRLIGKMAGAGDPYQSIPFATLQGYRDIGSCDGPKAVAIPFAGPAQAYDKLFGVGTPEALKRAQRTALLDFLSADITKMNRRLGGPERAKLDQYVSSIGDLEKRIVALAKQPAACEQPVAPTAAFRQKSASIRPEEIDAAIDVAFHAHLCGLTRVSHINLPAGGNPLFNFLRPESDKNVAIKDSDGIDQLWNPHEIHHRFDYPRMMPLDHWTFGRLALLLDRLSKAKDPGGNGTMLDNSLVAYINYCGGVHHQGQDKFGVVMAGRAGGAMKSGRYLTYPERQYCVSDLFTAWANAMDVPIDKFGDPRFCNGPLPRLLT